MVGSATSSILGQSIPDLYRLRGFHDPFCAISHLAGAAAFVALGYALLRRGRHDPARLAFLAVYAFSCVFLLSMSGVFHMTTRGGPASEVMLRLDHGAIFVLIAGTFTPIHGLLFRGPMRWGPLLLIWAAAAAGITFKTIYFYSLPEWLGLTFYLVLGWVGAASGVVLLRRYGFGFIKPLVWGAIAYSLGAVLDFLRWPVLVPGVVHSHEVFHVAVLAGAFFHWLFVWQFADGVVPTAPWGSQEPPAVVRDGGPH